MDSQTTGAGISVILLYHRLGLPKLSSMVAGQYVAPVLFRSEIDYLTGHGWQWAPLEDTVERARFGKCPPRCEFSITFDDAYQSVYRYAVPALLDRGMTATIYVVADSIGALNDWDQKAGDRQERIMSARQIREAADLGFEIGSHTLTHPHLTDLDETALRHELRDSKHRLEDITGKEVRSLAYPYGDYDDRVMAATIVAGYRYACATRLGVAGRTSVYELSRVNVRWNAIGPLLIRKIARARKKSGFRK